MQYPYMLTYALYTWAPCRGLGPGPGRCVTLLNDTDCGSSIYGIIKSSRLAAQSSEKAGNVHE